MSESAPATSITLDNVLDIAERMLHAGDYARADHLITQILPHAPNQPDLLSFKGIALQGLGHFAEAEDYLRRAQRLLPQDAGIMCNLATSLTHCGKDEEAEHLLRTALMISPGMAQAHYNLGNLLAKNRRHSEAEQCYRRALEHLPDYVDAAFNLGTTLRDLGRMDDAMAQFRRVLSMAPDFAQAHNNMGSLYAESGLLTEAERCFRAAVAQDPHYAEAWSNLGGVLLNLGRHDEAMECFSRAPGHHPDLSVSDSNRLLALHYDPAIRRKTLYEEAVAWGARHAPTALAAPYSHRDADRDPERRLRVGYVSADFKNHPAGYYAEGILAAHDSVKYEIFCYYNHHRIDDTTRRFQAMGHHWRQIDGMNDEQAAASIRADGIDILVDLSGHTAHHRLPLFARKPAPIQATWLGYFDTTGVAAIDYIIGDAQVIPPGDERFYSERVIRLPQLYCQFTPPACDVPVQPAPALKNNYVTFGSFNNITKITPPLAALWARVLQGAADSRLYLKSRALMDAQVRAQISALFEPHGIGGERLILEGFSPREEMLACYGGIDIALDSAPYNGGATTFEALWMGVPVVTLTGDRFVSRMGTSILSALSMPEWITASEDDYVRKTLALAHDVAALNMVRQGLRAKMLASPLCDGVAAARRVEAAYRTMWRDWCASSPGSG